MRLLIFRRTGSTILVSRSGGVHKPPSCGYGNSINDRTGDLAAVQFYRDLSLITSFVNSATKGDAAEKGPFKLQEVQRTLR